MNALEKAYKKTNTSRPLSRDAWITIIEAALVVIVPDITGWPVKYAVPLTLLVLHSIRLTIQRPQQWLRKIYWTAAICLTGYLFFTLLEKGLHIR